MLRWFLTAVMAAGCTIDVPVGERPGGFAVTPTSLSTTEAGGTASFTVTLTVQPTAEVRIDLASSDISEGTVSPASLTFSSSNWDAEQTVTVTGVDDNLADGPQSYSITLAAAFSADRAYHDVDPADVAVMNEDDDPLPGWVQQAYVKASNTDSQDNFGVVALSGDGNTLAVAAPGEASLGTGVGASQADNSGTGSGAVYVFSRLGTSWSQQAYLKASNADPNDFFGIAIALSADGNTLAVGAVGERSNATGVGGSQADNSASESGAAYVFVRTGNVWSQQAYLKASNTDAMDAFGVGIALSDDGNTLGVGASQEASRATGVGGIQTDNSASESGAVYVFARTGTLWSQQAYLKASNTDAMDFFGLSIALSGDGNTLAAAATRESSNATGVAGNQADNSASESGAVYVFVRTGGSWLQQAYLKASNTDASDWFGSSVSLSSDGNTLAVGAFGEDSNSTGVGGNQSDNSASDSGAVYVFVRAGGSWLQQAYLKASDASGDGWFGVCVDLSGDGNVLAVGAGSLPQAALPTAAAYMFARVGTSWTQQVNLKPSDANDFFGRFLALSRDGQTLAVGAIFEDSNATGINGNQTDESATDSGAVYLFSPL